MVRPARSAALALVLAVSAAPASAEPVRNDDAQEAASGRVIKLLGHIHESLRHSKYSHVTRVDEKQGSYEFDCSGMVAWVLRRSAPVAHGAVLWRAKKNRPLARDYYHQIASVKRDEPRHGWARVPRVDGALPGDVIAWLKPKEIRSPNTGHVAFLVEPPRPVQGMANAFALRIADASSYRHQRDTRSETGLTGFGVGTILVLADPETGAPRAYGWVGTRSAWVFETSIALGRVQR